MTKEQLIKKIEELEQELHNANNSVDYWVEESDKFQNLYYSLDAKISGNPIFETLQNCSLETEFKINEFLSKL